MKNIKIIKELYDDIENEGFVYALVHYRDYSAISEIYPELWAAIEGFIGLARAYEEKDHDAEEELENSELGKLIKKMLDYEGKEDGDKQ